MVLVFAWNKVEVRTPLRCLRPRHYSELAEKRKGDSRTADYTPETRELEQFRTSLSALGCWQQQILVRANR
jgi:hypothetical protein